MHWLLLQRGFLRASHVSWNISNFWWSYLPNTAQAYFVKLSKPNDQVIYFVKRTMGMQLRFWSDFMDFSAPCFPWLVHSGVICHFPLLLPRNIFLRAKLIFSALTVLYITGSCLADICSLHETCPVEFWEWTEQLVLRCIVLVFQFLYHTLSKRGEEWVRSLGC